MTTARPSSLVYILGGGTDFERCKIRRTFVGLVGVSVDAFNTNARSLRPSDLDLLFAACKSLSEQCFVRAAVARLLASAELRLLKSTVIEY